MPTLTELHAAFNDFPVVLLLASVVFDLLARSRKNEAMRWAAFWSLLGAAGFGIIAVISGLIAEEQFTKSPAVDRLIENHEALGIAAGLVLIALAGWRLWRKNRFSEAEDQSYLMVAVVTALIGIWLSHLGGTMVYRHGAGIPTTVLQQEIRERADSAPQANTQ